MAHNLINRVRKLEEKKAIRSTADPKELTNEELICAIRDYLEEEFQAGKLKDIDQKIIDYETVGKTFYDLSKEESEWFDDSMKRIIERFKAREDAEKV